MAIFNTPRAKINESGYMERVITGICNTSNSVIFRSGYGVIVDSAEKIISSFNMIQTCSRYMTRNKIHCMEFIIEAFRREMEVIDLADIMGKYFFEQGFQCFVIVVRLESSYLIELVINAISYVDGKAFHDNNDNYISVLQYLHSIVPYKWEVGVTDNVFFETGNLNKNYARDVFLS